MSEAMIDRSAGAQSGRADQQAAANAGTRNIYIVDDDEAMRKSLHRILSQQGDLAVRGFASGDAFLAAQDELDPGLVLLDYHMPGTSGIAVIERLADQRRKFAIVMLTVHGNVALAVAAMKAGVDDFLEKPYDIADLLSCIEGACRRLENDRQHAKQRDSARAKLAALSARENDVLTGLMAGHPNKEIARALGISPRTVEIYRANLMGKLEVDSLSHALRIAFSAHPVAPWDSRPPAGRAPVRAR